MKKVCYLTGKDWDMVEDNKGNLQFVKIDKKDIDIPVVNEEESMSLKDVPF